MLPGENTDSKNYLARTLPNIIKLAYQGRDKNSGKLILSLVELRKLDLMGGMNRFILEPIQTYEARSSVVYVGGARPHNVRGLCQLQRLASREQFCPQGSIFPQEVCSESLCSTEGISGCRVSMCTVDGGHNRIGLSDMLGSTALNVAVAFRL